MEIPITAVMTSKNNVASIPRMPKTAPLAAGAKKLVMAELVLCMPLTCTNASFGTSWGMTA